jgi:hypothetical protein
MTTYPSSQKLTPTSLVSSIRWVNTSVLESSFSVLPNRSITFLVAEIFPEARVEDE